MPLSDTKLRWDISVGGVIAAGVASVPTLMAVAGLIWTTASHNAVVDARAERIAGDLKVFQEQTRADLNSMQTLTRLEIERINVRGAQYIPKVELLEQSNKVQDERILAIGGSLRDIRQDVSAINQTVGRMGEDMATVRARLNIGRRTELTPQAESR